MIPSLYTTRSHIRKYNDFLPRSGYEHGEVIQVRSEPVRLFLPVVHIGTLKMN